jgi:hypothetical protein
MVEDIGLFVEDTRANPSVLFPKDVVRTHHIAKVVDESELYFIRTCL